MTDGELECRLEGGKVAEVGDCAAEVGLADVCCAMIVVVWRS